VVVAADLQDELRVCQAVAVLAKMEGRLYKHKDRLASADRLIKTTLFEDDPLNQFKVAGAVHKAEALLGLGRPHDVPETLISIINLARERGHLSAELSVTRPLVRAHVKCSLNVP
jgi:hypothetical protein